jgi:O-antigen ligase
MSQTGVADFSVVREQSARLRIAYLLSGGVFGALICLVVLTAIPYGTTEPWWRAAFVCAIFAICLVAIIENLLNESRGIVQVSVLLPMLTLAALAFFQTLSIGSVNFDSGRTQLQPWNAVSADPYETRFFVLQLLALTACLALLYRYAATERRIRVLVHVVIGVAVASAVFGILRQTTQQQVGFGLPLIKPNQGYGQFINKNHFAYLMEMAFGLGVGIMVAGGVKRDRILIYVALLLPVWTGLVLSNSRGGVLAMLAQVVVAALLFLSLGIHSGADRNQRNFPTIAQSITVRTVLLVVLVGGILFGTVWVGGDRLVTNFEAVGGEFNSDADVTRDGSSRNEIWRATLKMFAAHPLLGVGLGGYWIGITAYHDASGNLTPQQAHNDYLELLSSGGLLGFAVGVWFAVIVYRLARKNLSADTGFNRAVRVGAALGIAGVAVHSLVDFGLHMVTNALIFIILIMIVTAKIDSRGMTT